MPPIIISTANSLPTSAAYISTAYTLPAGVPYTGQIQNIFQTFLEGHMKMVRLYY